MEKDMQDAVINYGLTCYKRGMRDFKAIVSKFLYSDLSTQEALDWAEDSFNELSVDKFLEEAGGFFVEKREETQDE